MSQLCKMCGTGGAMLGEVGAADIDGTSFEGLWKC